jgi:hypothetical protein
LGNYSLRWWNAQTANYDKSRSALEHLLNWAGAIAPPPGLGWPGGMVPNVPPVNIWGAVCEAMGGAADSFGVLPGHGLGTGRVNTFAAPHNASYWMAVRSRNSPASRRSQYGYLGRCATAGGAVVPLTSHRLDKNLPGAWPGAGKPNWPGYPDHIVLAHPVRAYRPTEKRVRQYVARREIICQTSAEIDVFWYHAISGGGPCTVFDLWDALNLMTQHAQANAALHPVRRATVLIGDINLLPEAMYEVVRSFRGGVAPLMDTAIQVPHGGMGIVVSPEHTHTATATPRRLDYAIVLYDGHSAAGAPINAFVQVGVPPPLGVVANYRNAIDVFGVLPAFQSDHRPIRVQVEI